MQLAPAYDLVELLKPLNNPFSTLPGTVNNNPFQRLTNFQNVNQLTSLWRSKRQASSGLLNADQNDFIEFLEDFGEFKEGIATKMGNLTCVLTEMKLLTPDLKINIDEYMKPVAEIEGFKPEISVAGTGPRPLSTGTHSPRSSDATCSSSSVLTKLRGRCVPRPRCRSGWKLFMELTPAWTPPSMVCPRTSTTPPPSPSWCSTMLPLLRRSL